MMPTRPRLRFYNGTFLDCVNSNCVMVGMQGCVPNKTTTGVLAIARRAKKKNTVIAEAQVEIAVRLSKSDWGNIFQQSTQTSVV